ncbi:Arm DNA-binding domain-containing protein [Spirosoma flavum]|uniref:Arm DNA-binding domain-containing protein n=1 Tax=Spirosoma flavum TaxID=2048557 RepID=A0ABW6ALQ2_9BACT
MQISFWRHKSKLPGKIQLYCRITVAKVRIDMGSTGLTLYADHWDGERISYEDPEAFFKNEQLDIMRNQLRAIYNDLFRRKEKITGARVVSSRSALTNCTV